METPKSKTLLNFARVLTGFVAAGSIFSLLVSPQGGIPFEWYSVTIFMLVYGILGIVIAVALGKSHRVLSGILVIAGYAYILIDSVARSYDLSYLLCVGVLFSPPLIAGILFFKSAHAMKQAAEQHLTIPLTESAEQNRYEEKDEGI